jgi:hypothetical protein
VWSRYKRVFSERGIWGAQGCQPVIVGRAELAETNSKQN